MELTFIGAAREVTGSCHLLSVGPSTIALDCGMFQGRRSEAQAKNLALPQPIASLDGIVLSHAHIDHSGRLPFLARQGFRRSIWATPATRDLAAVMLADSAHIQEKDAEYLSRHSKAAIPPLYSVSDAAAAVDLMIGVSYHKPMAIVPGVRLEMIDAGHILGSASVILDCTENGRSHRIVFSGDIGRRGLPIIRDPETPTGADVVIMESTYGDRTHESVADAQMHLGQVVRETAARGGKVFIPAFAVGRTQEIIYDLHALSREGKVPPIPIYVDSPLAIDATSIFAMHPELFDQREELVRSVGELFRFPLVQFTRSVDESKGLNKLTGPAVIIAASGMAESGRILHHLANGAGNPANTILIVGFQAEHTLGRRIVERQRMIKVFGNEIPLRARVAILNGYSAHADSTELVDWLDAVRSRSPNLSSVFLVHGEASAQGALAVRLREKRYRVQCPAAHTRVALPLLP